MPKVILIIIRYLQRFPRNFKHKPILSFYSFAIVARNIFGCFFCGTMRALCCQLWQLFGSQDTALNADQSNQAKHWGNDVDDDDNEENDDEDKDIHMFFYKSQIRSLLALTLFQRTADYFYCWYSLNRPWQRQSCWRHCLWWRDSSTNILCFNALYWFREALKKLYFLGIFPTPVDPLPP